MPDLKQGKLYLLFSRLRELKQRYLPIRMPDPVEQAEYERRIRIEIALMETRIEEEMRRDYVSPGKNIDPGCDL